MPFSRVLRSPSLPNSAACKAVSSLLLSTPFSPFAEEAQKAGSATCPCIRLETPSQDPPPTGLCSPPEPSHLELCGEDIWMCPFFTLPLDVSHATAAHAHRGWSRPCCWHATRKTRVGVL